MTNIIPLKPEPKKYNKCSFCGKQETQVKSLVASADGKYHICDECIELAIERLNNGTY